MLIPEIRAMVSRSPLPLLVTRIRADDQHAPMAADDLALFAHRLDRRSYLHDPFRLVPVDPALAAGAAAATASRTKHARATARLRARRWIVPKALEESCAQTPRPRARTRRARAGPMPARIRSG